jgi:thymidylate synthase ThyX
MFNESVFKELNELMNLLSKVREVKNKSNRIEELVNMADIRGYKKEEIFNDCVKELDKYNLPESMKKEFIISMRNKILGNNQEINSDDNNNQDKILSMLSDIILVLNRLTDRVIVIENKFKGVAS